MSLSTLPVRVSTLQPVAGFLPGQTLGHDVTPFLGGVTVSRPGMATL